MVPIRFAKTRAQAGMLRGVSVVALLAASGSLLATPAAAEGAPTGGNAATVEEVIVTARLRSERQQDVPVAMTAITGAKLKELEITSIADITKFVPGMVVGRQTTGSSASIFLRGVGSASLSAGFDQSVSFNIDGLSMTRGREITFSQYDIERVEVLKGPQALYFGKNTTAGLITIVSSAPTNSFEADARLGYGVVARETYGDAVVSGPLSDTLKARLAVHATRSEGYFTNSAGPTVDVLQGSFARAPVDSRRGGNDSVSGRLTLQYDPSSNLNLTLKAGATDYNDNGAADLNERVCGGGRTVPRPTSGIVDTFADCTVNGRNDYSTLPIEVARGMHFARDGRPYTDLTSQFGILNGSYTFGKLAATSITGYYHFHQGALNTVSGAFRSIAVTEDTNFDQFSQEVRLQSNLGGPVDFMVGAYYASMQLRLNTDTYASVAPFDAVNQTYSTFRRLTGIDGESKSIFGEVTWKIVPTVELAAGARASWEQKDSFLGSAQANSAFNAAFPPNRRLDDHYKEDNVSPQVTLSWKPNEDLTVYAAYKTGFKAGGFNISASLNAASTVPQNEFKSEDAKGGEIGLHAALFDRSLRLNAAAYDYDYTNLQVQFFDPSTLAQISANAGKLTTKGVESDFSWRVSSVEGLSIHGAVALNNAVYHNFIGQCYAGQSVAQGCNRVPALGVFQSQDYGARTAPKAPKFAGQVGFKYGRSVSQKLWATVTGDMNYSSSYNYNDALRPDAIQASFARFDATFRIEDRERGWALSLIGRNLSDRKVITSNTDVIGTGSTPAGTGTVAGGLVTDMNAVVDRGREVYLEFGYKF